MAIDARDEQPGTGSPGGASPALQGEEDAGSPHGRGLPRLRVPAGTRRAAALRVTPRALSLAASVAWRHLTADLVRSVLLAWRVLPAPARSWLRLAGPYGRAAAVWGAGDREAALAALEPWPGRLAAFALAVDRPEAARAAIARLADGDPARPRLLARLAWREGRLTDALAALDGGRRRGEWRLRRSLAAQLALLERGLSCSGTAGDGTSPGGTPAGGTPLGGAAPSGTAPRRTVHGGTYRNGGPVRGRVLHLVNDALPSVRAGYTIRTHQIAVAQQAAGLDPHVVTPCGFPVTRGTLDGRRLVPVDGVPYHRLLPWVLPPLADAAARQGLEAAAGLAARLRPAVLHAASNYANGQLALAVRDVLGLPVVYEVRGFWEDTWLSRHGGAGPGTAADLAGSELYRRSREMETRCMRGADLVVTLGEAMREEIAARGVPEGKIVIVPNAVTEEFLQPLPDGRALRERLGIGPGEQVVGLVSSLAAHEGIGTFLEAAALLRGRGVPLRPLVVGDGPERAALQHLAGQLRLPAIFTGQVPAADVRQYHALFDIFVVPRTSDRVCQLVTPLKPVEAMASGLCVVTSEVAALQEIVKDQVTGRQTVPQDPVSLADCLESLLYSPGVRRKLGAGAREWVARERTWARNAAIYRAAYERLGAV